MVEQLNAIARLWWDWSIAMFWQVGLLILVIAVIDRLIRRWAWPQLRYALWSLILIKLLLPPSLSLPSGIVPSLAPVVRQALIRLESERPPVAAEGRALLFLNEEMLRVPAVEAATPVAISGGGLVGSVPARAYPQTPDGVTTSESLGHVAAVSPLTSVAWQVYAMTASLAGTLILGIWLFLRLRALVGRRAQETAAASLPESFYNQLAGCAKRLELRSIPRVVVTKRLATPAVFGLFRPVLLMPRGYLSRLSRRDTEHMLLHELAHIKRGDLVAHSLYMALQVVYWYNPLLWLVRRQMHHLRELSCDATVAEVLREQTMAYRQTLLETARRLLTSSVEPGLGLLGLFEDSNRLLVRLNWLTKPTWRYRNMKRVTVATIAALMLACVLPMARAQQAAANEVQQVETPQDTEVARQMAELERRLDHLRAEQQQLQKDLQTLAETRRQTVAPRRERLSEEIDVTVVPAEPPVRRSTREETLRIERARAEGEARRAQAEARRAAAEGKRAEAEAKRHEEWALQHQEWAESEPMKQWQAEVEKWQNSDEMKRWQQEVEKWGQEMGRRYEQGVEGSSGSEAVAPMPPMPAMPVMPPMDKVSGNPPAVAVVPHVSATPRPVPHVKVTVPRAPAHVEPVDLPDGDRVVQLQLPERMKLIDLMDLVGKHTGMNYIYDPALISDQTAVGLRGKLSGTMQVKDLYRLLQSALESQNLAMVRREGNVATIVPKPARLDVPHVPTMPPVPTPRSVPAPLQEDVDIEVQAPDPEAPVPVSEIPAPPAPPAIPHEQLRHLDVEMQKLQEHRQAISQQRQHTVEQVQRVNEQIKEKNKDIEKSRSLLYEQQYQLQEQQEQLRRHARDLPNWDDDTDLEEATSVQSATEPLAPDQVLEIANDFGSIAVRGDDGDTVRIVATVKGRGETMDEARAIVEQTKLDIKRSEGKLSVAMTKPQPGEQRREIRRKVDLELVVPRAARIKLGQAFGGVRLRDLSGSVKAAANMGSIEAVAVSGEVALAANFGAIDFVASPDLSAKIQANAQFGSVQSSLPLRVVKPGQFSMGSLASGVIGAGEGTVSLTTNMGSIRIRSQAEESKHQL